MPKLPKYGTFVKVDMSKCAKTRPCLHIVEFIDKDGDKEEIMVSGKVIAKKFWSKLSEKEQEHFEVYRE